MIETVLSVDIGTTSLKAALITAEGEVLSFYKSSYSAPQNRFVAEGWLWSLKSSIEKLLKSVEKDSVCIIAVSVSGNGPTLVSDSGFTIRWNEEVEKLMLMDEDITTKSLFLPKIATFKVLFPEEYENTEYIYSGPEFLIYQLTGRAVTVLPEERFISAYWTDEELDELKIAQGKLPPYINLGKVCGRVIPDASEFLGLPEDIPVFSAGPDFVAALIGTNTLSPGKICDRSGSSEGINYCCETPVYGEGLRTLPSIIPGLWNISVVITKSSTLNAEERLSVVKGALDNLKKVIIENNMTFPSEMTVTGGQTNDLEYMKKKEALLGMKLKVCKCSDSELIGDACVAWYGLGKYSSIKEAAENLCK